MSAPTTTYKPDRAASKRMSSKLVKGLAAVAAVAALAFGATAITKGDSSSTSGGAVQDVPAGAPGGTPPVHGVERGGPPGGVPPSDQTAPSGSSPSSAQAS